MNQDNPAFVTCAMESIEQGIHAEDIKEECACRLGLNLAPDNVINNDK